MVGVDVGQEHGVDLLGRDARGREPFEIGFVELVQDRSRRQVLAVTGRGIDQDDPARHPHQPSMDALLQAAGLQVVGSGCEARTVFGQGRRIEIRIERGRIDAIEADLGNAGHRGVADLVGSVHVASIACERLQSYAWPMQQSSRSKACRPSIISI